MKRLDDYNFELIAPVGVTDVAPFSNIRRNPVGHANRIKEIQQLRGLAYSQQGFIQQEELEPVGRYVTAQDSEAWQVVVVDARGRIVAAADCQFANAANVTNLRINELCVRLGDQATALQSTLRNGPQQASNSGVAFAETGGWAAHPDHQNSFCGVFAALACWSFYGMVGHAIVIAAANAINGASTALKRMGAVPLLNEESSVVYDAWYDTNLELLRMDTRFPALRFRPVIAAIQARLAEARILTAG